MSLGALDLGSFVVDEEEAAAAANHPHVREPPHAAPEAPGPQAARQRPSMAPAWSLVEPERAPVYNPPPVATGPPPLIEAEPAPSVEDDSFAVKW